LELNKAQKLLDAAMKEAFTKTTYVLNFYQSYFALHYFLAVNNANDYLRINSLQVIEERGI